MLYNYEKPPPILLAFVATLFCLGSCTQNKTAAEENYLEVIGEYEQQLPGAGYRLNLSYNGPVAMRHAFVAWADSLQRRVPDMVKANEGIYQFERKPPIPFG